MDDTSRMIIKRLDLKNIAEYMDLLKNFHENVKLDEFGIKFDKESVLEALCREELRTDNYTIHIEDEGIIIGIAIVITTPSIMNKHHLKATEVIWHVDDRISKKKRVVATKTMFSAIEDWISSKNVDTAHISCPVDNDIHKYLEKKGYKLAEYTYIKRC